MLGTGSQSGGQASAPFDINKFEELLNKLEASRSQQKQPGNAQKISSVS